MPWLGLDGVVLRAGEAGERGSSRALGVRRGNVPPLVAGEIRRSGVRDRPAPVRAISDAPCRGVGGAPLRTPGSSCRRLGVGVESVCVALPRTEVRSFRLKLPFLVGD